MKNRWLKISSILALTVCLVLAWLNFSGRLSTASFKLWFLVFSLVYFVAATLSVGKKSGA
ncbi:MAG: hypothetical protein NUW07_07510 [Candidatus Saccharicenans sp.]|jgi:hypothetical protein|nr:hypothetical protein [Candidatus Saccharicenans sp.]MDH7492417.1 hypothetical protein [Candidatus Saccharicenans sp.]